jgi:hypothetical protein
MPMIDTAVYMLGNIINWIDNLIPIIHLGMQG